MAILSPAIRGGPTAAVLAALLAVAPASAGQRHYYSIHGSLAPDRAAASAGNGALSLTSRLAPAISSIPAQTGNGLVLTAKLALAPLVCYGDTIFQDGFDP